MLAPCDNHGAFERKIHIEILPTREPATCGVTANKNEDTTMADDNNTAHLPNNDAPTGSGDAATSATPA
eukprot:5736346-Pyramimonas_sp.AAC.1